MEPEPLYLLQIVKARPPYEVVVRMGAGGRLERDLIGSCVEAIVAKGVGYFRSETVVRRAIEAGMTEAIHALKRETL